MTVIDDVRALVDRLAPAPICDDCVADRLGLSVRQHANHKTRELAGSNGFKRRTGRPARAAGQGADGGPTEGRRDAAGRRRGRRVGRPRGRRPCEARWASAAQSGGTTAHLT